MRKGFKHIVKVFATGIIYILFSQQLTAQHHGTDYPTGTQVNFVRTWDATAPEQDPNTLMTRPLKDVKQATQYLDGLGRSLQTVIKKGSLETDPSNAGSSVNATDIVSPVEYDVFGREQYKFLPYAEPTSNNGAFKLTPFVQQVNFMTNKYGAQGENYFYSKTNFEASPVNRPAHTYAPGISWAGSEINVPAQQRNVQMQYLVNTDIDAVRMWTVTDNATIGVFGTYATTAVYPAGELYKTITIDEHKKQVIEFKDKEGRVILKKVQLTALPDDGTGSGYPNWLNTFYIYDDFGNLRCVIQPEGVKTLFLNGWVIDYSPPTGGLVAEQCFRYEYDQRNHMVTKKVPGAGEIRMVFDARDRLVMTQDANMRLQQKWMYTTYDEVNRSLSTGLITDPSNYNNHSYHLNSGYTSNTYPILANYTSEELTTAFYDNYNWLSSYSNPLPATYSAVYDTYFQATSNTVWPYAQANSPSTQLKELPTGSRVKVLGTATYLYNISFYDDKGRVIQSQGTNVTGGTDIVTTQYNWAGQPLVMIQKQQKGGTTNPQEHVVITKMQYDDLGRVLNVKKTINSNVNSIAVTKPEQHIVKNEYDKLGQLKKKSLGNKPNTNPVTPLAKLDYEYNIRGWLLSVNKDYVTNSTNTDQYFGMQLGYDKNGSLGSFVPQYNSNISGTIWKSDGDQEKRKYDFGYDAANRLMKADFTQYTGGAFNQNALVNFDVKIGDGNSVGSAYDDNGNIKRMQQWGLKINTSLQIDDLTYQYQNTSNKLAKVTDGILTADNGKLGDFKDGTNTGTDDYSYDVNGNLNLDNNKAIGAITYNHLNLPAVISIPTKGSISYTYDAAGNKIKKQTIENPSATNGNKTITTTTTYVGGMVYETKTTSPADPNSSDYTDRLQFMGHEEGRIRFKPALGNIAPSFQYDYMLKDHLGNVRMVLTEEVQEDKYPVASLEDAKISIEDQYYTIDNSKIVLANTVTGLPAYTNDNGIGNNPSDPTFEAANSTKLYKLNSSSNLSNDKMGLGITLKVMAGDKIDVLGKSYYFTNTSGTGGNSAIPAVDLLAAFLNAPAAAATTAGHGAVTPAIINTPAGTTGLNSMITQQGNQSNATPNKPRAFINVIFFDEQFKTYDGGFSISMVGNNSVVKDHYAELQNLIANKSGYVYIYCSNESPVNVFFDNIQVVHKRGAILEETHYYPFGLTMAGISSKAAGKLQNKRKFNSGTELGNQEFSDGSGLEIYETPYRSYDPQMGRFHQIDPLAFLTSDVSPYAFALNNPILRNDPTGLKDSVTLAPVVVVSHPKKLQGGSYNGQTFNSIKSFTSGFGGVRKTVLNNSNAVTYFGIEISGFKSNEELLKFIGEIGGAISIKKSGKEYLELLKKALKKNLKGLIPGPGQALASMFYVEGMKMGAAAEDLQKVFDTYIKIHKEDPSQQKGIYEIQYVQTYFTSDGTNNVYWVNYYYDISTKQFLGDAKIR